MIKLNLSHSEFTELVIKGKLETFKCEDCQQVFTEFYEYKDDYRQVHICEDCFNDEFARQATAKNKDWFVANYNEPVKQFPKLLFLLEV